MRCEVLGCPAQSYHPVGLVLKTSGDVKRSGRAFHRFLMVFVLLLSLKAPATSGYTRAFLSSGVLVGFLSIGATPGLRGFRELGSGRTRAAS